MDIRQRVGKRVRALRAEAGLSQEELAHGAGVNRAFLGQLERGLRSPRLETLEKLARALKVRMRDLVDVDVERRPAPLSPLEKLARRVVATAQRAPRDELVRFGEIADTFFSRFRRRRRVRRR